VDVQIAACHVAEKVKAPEFRGPALKALGSAREHWLVGAAESAAHEMGLRFERVEIWVSRLDEDGMAAECLDRLANLVIADLSGYGHPSRDGLGADEGKACKQHWTKFLKEHGAELREGKRFKLGDPALTPELFPKFQFERK
jgi:hypothetical protein